MAIYIMLAVLAILAFLIILGSEIGPGIAAETKLTSADHWSVAKTYKEDRAKRAKNNLWSLYSPSMDSETNRNEEK